MSRAFLTGLVAVALGGGLAFWALLATQDADAERAATGPRDGAPKAERAPEQPLNADELGPKALAADAESVAELVREGRADVWACASCHGEDGGGAGLVPRLAGLPAGYIAKQLHDYQSGRRVNANMQTVADALSDQEILALAHHYARMNTPSTARPALGGDLARGRVLAQEGEWSVAVPACFSCHGSSGWGVGNIFPPLAAQHPTYIMRQLAAWDEGTRANSPVRLMKGVAHNLSHADRRAVADYLASLPAPPAVTTRQSSGDRP